MTAATAVTAHRPGQNACEDGSVSTGTPSSSRLPHLNVSAVLREGEQVTPLELFFDLVFVLALTQCTALIARTPTWEGMLKGLLVLGMLWWSWSGYAWLTSVVDPEEGAVRLAMFAAMAAFLVAALCVPGAFGSEALLFACAYAVVRAAHIALFMLASRDDSGAAPFGARSGRQHGDRRRAAVRRARSRRARCSSGCGGSRWCSTWVGRTCSAPTAGSSCPATSPSATARS